MGREENRGPLGARELPQYLRPVPGPSPGQASPKGSGVGPAWPAGPAEGECGDEPGPAVVAETEAGRGAPGCVSPRVCGVSEPCVSGQAARRAPPAGEVW